MRDLYLSEIVARMRIEELHQDAARDRLARSVNSKQPVRRWKNALVGLLRMKLLTGPVPTALNSEEPC